MRKIRLIILLTCCIAVACNRDKEYICTYTFDRTGDIRNSYSVGSVESTAQFACDNADSEIGVTCVLDEE
ncbi:MAG: hypothetical protein AAF960_11260 [Bacteroidota bacterium]